MTSNSQGGIRGIFYFNSERYAYLATLKIGCQNMSIFNLDRNIEIFDTDCHLIMKEFTLMVLEEQVFTTEKKFIINWCAY